jgi:hypothetical protein
LKQDLLAVRTSMGVFVVSDIFHSLSLV